VNHSPPLPQAKSSEPIFDTESLTIRVSYKCNIGCKFCYNTSLPDNEIALSEERMLALVKDGWENGFRRLGISGGEAFLYAKSVMKVIKLAKELGYTAVSIVTNGFWGKYIKSTNIVLSMLKEAGFSAPPDMLAMSAGEFHQEWIPPSNAKNIISEYNRTFGVPFTIDFEVTKGKEHLEQEFRDYLSSEGIPEDAYNIRLRKIIANLGRGKDLEDGVAEVKPIGAFGKCNAVNRFVVQPDGKVVPCCGFNRFNDGIVLGNIHESSVAQIIKDANSNFVNQLLTHKPLYELYDALKMQFVMPKNFTVACEICEAIFGKEEHIEHLKKNVDLT